MASVKSSALKVLIRSAMFLTYLFAGAAIFLLLEKNEQEQQRSLASEKLTNYENELIFKFNVTNTEIMKLRDLVEEALDVGAHGKKMYLREWTFANAFFFCGNVITTIGKKESL